MKIFKKKICEIFNRAKKSIKDFKMDNIKNTYKKVRANWSHIKVILKFLLITFVVGGTLAWAGTYYVTHDPDFYVDKIPKHLYTSLQEYAENNSDICDASFIERLKLVNVKYYTSNGQINKEGTLIVLDLLSDRVLKIFKELYKKKLMIGDIKPITQYGRHDISISDNNVISYICQKDLQDKFAGYNLMYHYGAAIDLNPLTNPMISIAGQYDKNSYAYKIRAISANYINRYINNKLYNENFVGIFAKNGLTEWGGNFSSKQKDNLIAWQYFGLNPIIVKLILEMNKDDAKEFLDIFIMNHDIAQKINKEEFYSQIHCAYKNNKKSCFKFLKKNFKKLNNISDSEFFNLLSKECSTSLNANN